MMNCSTLVRRTVPRLSMWLLKRPPGVEYPCVHLHSVHKVNFSQSCIFHNDDIKKDKDLKSILSELYEDFGETKTSKKDPKDKPVTSDKDDIVSDKIKSRQQDGSNAAKQDEKFVKKDLQDLLSEIYASEAKETTSLGGYSEYRDADAPVIYDVDEERTLRMEAQERGEVLEIDKHKERKTKYKYQEMTKTHGERGVFEIEEIVQVLKGERITDVAVIKVPELKQYVDFLVIGTGRNSRQLFVASQIIKKLYKSKAYETDPSLSVDGEKDKGKSGWIAMDLGNVAIHLFTQERRDYYDLETLWTVGSAFDELSRPTDTSDQLANLMASHLQEFEPASDTTEPTPEILRATESYSTTVDENKTEIRNDYMDENQEHPSEKSDQNDKDKNQKNRKLWLA